MAGERFADLLPGHQIPQPQGSVGTAADRVGPPVHHHCAHRQHPTVMAGQGVPEPMVHPGPGSPVHAPPRGRLPRNRQRRDPRGQLPLAKARSVQGQQLSAHTHTGIAVQMRRRPVHRRRQPRRRARRMIERPRDLFWRPGQQERGIGQSVAYCGRFGVNGVVWHIGHDRHSMRLPVQLIWLRQRESAQAQAWGDRRRPPSARWRPGLRSPNPGLRASNAHDHPDLRPGAGPPAGPRWRGPPRAVFLALKVPADRGPPNPGFRVSPAQRADGAQQAGAPGTR